MGIETLNKSLLSCRAFAEISDESIRNQLSLEAATLCHEMITAASVPVGSERKSPNITGIQTDKGIIIYPKGPLFCGKGIDKCCKVVAFVSEAPEGNGASLKLSVSNKGFLKPHKGNNSQFWIDLFKEEGERGIDLNSVQKMAHTDSWGVYESCSRKDSTRPGKRKPYILSDLYSKSLEKIDFDSLSRVQKIEIIRQMIESIRNLHKKRLVHRDVKVHNFFLGEKGEVVLGDLLRVMSPKASLFEAVGTLICCSPLYHINYFLDQDSKSFGFESPEVGEKMLVNNDLWGLGCAVYSVLTGYMMGFIEEEGDKRTCFHEGSLYKTFQDDLDFSLEELKDEDSSMKEILRDLLVVKPGDDCSLLSIDKIFEKFNRLFPVESESSLGKRQRSPDLDDLNEPSKAMKPSDS